MSPGPALALLAALVAASLLAAHTVSLAAIVVVLALACVGARGRHAWIYLIGIAFSAITLFVLTPLVETIGSHPLWSGPVVPVLGPVDVTREELWSGAHGALRLAAVGLAFAAYTLLIDHDRLLDSAGFARRFVLTVVLATRLAPTLERDACDLAHSLRARGVEVRGLRARGRLLSPLLSGSLERALNLAEAMEARGYGRGARSQPPRSRWTRRDGFALLLAVVIAVAGASWF